MARELTKFYEETKTGTLGELAAFYDAVDVKGEIVIIVGRDQTNASEIDLNALLRERLKHLTLRDAVAEVADMTGLKKKEVYDRALVINTEKE